MKLTLDFKERLVFASILTSKGKILDMKVREDLTSRIPLSQEELTGAGLVVESENYKWDDKKAEKYKKEFDLSGAEVEYLKKCVNELEKNEQVDPNNLSVCVKVRDLK